MTERLNIDLHTHSDRSDGALPPAELVLRAATAGVEVLALTDHDTTAGVDAAAAGRPRRRHPPGPGRGGIGVLAGSVHSYIGTVDRSRFIATSRAPANASRAAAATHAQYVRAAQQVGIAGR